MTKHNKASREATADAFNRVAARLRGSNERCSFLGTGGGREHLVTTQEECGCWDCDLAVIFKALRKAHGVRTRKEVLSRLKKRASAS